MQVQSSRDNESTMFGCIVQMQMHVKVVQIIAETLGFSERPSRLGSHNQPNIFMVMNIWMAFLLIALQCSSITNSLVVAAARAR